MSELEYYETMIKIIQGQIDKAEYDIKHYVKELNMVLALKRAVVEKNK
jgi:hypothetical protein